MPKRRLGNLAERLVHAALDRLRRLGRNLLRKRIELLALLRQRFELLARMRARELDDFRQCLRRHHFAGKIERGISVHARHFDHLETVVGGTFGGGGVGGLEDIRRLFGDGLHLLVGILGLGDAALREFAESGRHLDLRDVKLGHFEFRHFEHARRRLGCLYFRGSSCGFRHDTRPCFRLLLGCSPGKFQSPHRPLREASYLFQ